jgi:YHS domain-containing protein
MAARRERGIAVGLARPRSQKRPDPVLIQEGDRGSSSANHASIRNPMKLALALLSIPLSLGLAGCNTCRSASGSALKAGEARYFVNTDGYGVALQGGHDPVAFFTMGKPVQGSKSWQSRYNGATYWFASAENLKTFEANPAKYEPAFGGYCGYAASINRVSPIDVEFFQILDGRLVLQHNQRALDKWNADVPGNLKLADANWPGLVEKNARGDRILVNLDDDGVALEGHDPVAYFTEHRPIPGKPEFQSNYNGAIYRFASMENRVTFENAPEKYVPAFGGFCGYAASINKVSPVNIHIFQIVNGRLVLQHTPKAYALFNQDLTGNLGKADLNWPGLVACKGE